MQHFERLVAREHAQQSLFFEDAIYGMDADARYQTTAAITPPEYNASNGLGTTCYTEMAAVTRGLR
ncbi:hypothetical protein E5D57_001558 [Metarhizium anisopliae]|nr:hypothetical protein E5D57_001558 [Metarhizium anisopliae]